MSLPGLLRFRFSDVWVTVCPVDHSEQYDEAQRRDNRGNEYAGDSSVEFGRGCVDDGCLLAARPPTAGGRYEHTA